MIIDLTKLNNNLIKEIKINNQLEISKDKLSNTDILSLLNVKVNGTIKKNNIDIILSLTISGIMKLPCAITLEEVSHPFEIELNGNLNDLIEENEQQIKKNENTIDIFPIIWENILVEIPMKVLSEKSKNYKAEGKGWKLITDLENKSKINPELEKLKKLL